ncbi:flowering time control protein FCA isoform X3 [Amborella trichopoda]|uniref:flowering time control protein FCA isoform X3 n=1 Tax=Amborella trichopoda TaxID=13333 RepID=UPI0005D35653|nr:flowering time control protein FCA isoform X3 [Amborella trichopoda]|eukprot:XP_011628628.1 flowering time control protein FCA isoform X3 [Amborella trichopoda]
MAESDHTRSPPAIEQNLAGQKSTENAISDDLNGHSGEENREVLPETVSDSLMNDLDPVEKVDGEDSRVLSEVDEDEAMTGGLIGGNKCLDVESRFNEEGSTVKDSLDGDENVKLPDEVLDEKDGLVTEDDSLEHENMANEVEREIENGNKINEEMDTFNNKEPGKEDGSMGMGVDKQNDKAFGIGNGLNEREIENEGDKDINEENGEGDDVGLGVKEAPEKGDDEKEIGKETDENLNEESDNRGVVKEDGARTEEEEQFPEVKTVEILSHWLPKPCVRVTITGGSATEEELLPLFTEHGKVSSIAFENEKRDATVVRFDSAPGDNQLAATVQEKLHNTQLGVRTLLVEAFRADSLLFVGNLTPDIDDSSLRTMFEPHGKVERAFVLRNAAGQSKGYGFIEYSLKSQAIAAKTTMGVVNMDGRVLRVEWSDCKNIEDMFSTVLFVDRISKHMPNPELALRSLFGQYGKVKDCFLPIGINGNIRGFGFIDFFHSACADKAHIALDGHELGGLNIRVSFANPSKSAQSYKQRLGNQGPAQAFGGMGRGAIPGMTAASRGNGYMPFMANQFVGAVARSSVLGVGAGMAYNRGTPMGPRILEQNVMDRGNGILSAGAPMAGVMGRPPFMGNISQRQGMSGLGNLASAQHFINQGTYPSNLAAAAQMALLQGKVYQDSGKFRAQDLYKQVPQQAKQGHSQYPYQPHQHQTQQSYQQHALPQPHHSTQELSYAQSQQYLLAAQQAQYQVQQQHSQNYTQQTEIHTQPPQQTQHYPQGTSYYNQQNSVQAQSYGTSQQQYQQAYGQAPVNQYDQYAQQPSHDHFPQTTVATTTNQAVSYPAQFQDGAQQQAYASYHGLQQQAGLLATPTSGAQQTQSTDAQYAAYYAAQALYLQQTQQQQQQGQAQGLQSAGAAYQEQTAADYGQKRAFDQMENDQHGMAQQTQYGGYPSGYAQPQPQSQPAILGAYQQQQQQQQQPVAAAADGYHQQQPQQQVYQAASTVAATDAKRPRF